MLTEADRRILLAADPRNSRVFRVGQPAQTEIAVVEIRLAIDPDTVRAAKQRALKKPERD